jgi:hypothetical protein
MTRTRHGQAGNSRSSRFGASDSTHEAYGKLQPPFSCKMQWAPSATWCFHWEGPVSEICLRGGAWREGP